MLLRECIGAEVCKYLNEVDVSMSLCVCKILNILVKKHVRVITDIYKAKYAEFSGLMVAKFLGKYGVLPPNLTTLCVRDIPLDYTLLPKTLTSLTLSNANDSTICDESLEYLAPSLTKLDITINYYNTSRIDLSILTNLLDLRTYNQLFADLPPNLTRLVIHNDLEDLTYLWKKLPINLVTLRLYCRLGHVFMKDLPLSLEKITILNLNEDSNTLQMRSDDYFNKNIQHVNIDMDNVDTIQKLHSNITSFDCNMYAFGMIYPKSLTKLTVYINHNFDIDTEFYKNLPPNLLSLSIDANTGSISLYPSLLPRSLTKLQTLDSYLYLGANDGMDFPPNIVYINTIQVNKYQTDTLDFSKLTQLRTLQIDDIDVIDKTFKILLPSNLASFIGNVNRVAITNSIIEVIYYNGTVSAEFINNLPKSITNLELCYIDDIYRAVFPPNLRMLTLSRMQLSIEELNKLPQTLECYKQSYRKEVNLIRCIDGNKWKFCGTQYILRDTSTVNIENGANLDNRTTNNYECDEIIEECDV